MQRNAIPPYVHVMTLMIALATSAAQGQERPSDGFQPIFDGRTLTGWEGSRTWFRVEDQAIVAGSLKQRIPHNVFLCTQSAYEDFELRFEAKVIGDNQNGGLQFRSRRIPDDHEVIGYQCDIGVAGSPVWGALYDESRRRKFLVAPDQTLLKQVCKPNDWNALRVRCEGDRIRIWLNERLTVDFKEPDAAVARRGVIAVQIHGGPPAEVWYRKLRIKELGA